MRGPARALATAALAAALVLPPPGTESREREFCGGWLGLGPGERQAVLVEAEAREAGAGWRASCRAGLRAGLRHKLDAECRNWPLLMAFEVRVYVDGVLEPCREGAPAGASP